MVGSWTGLALFICNNLTMATSMSVVIQMSLQVPVFQRELQNKMYGPFVYLNARLISNWILMLFYPTVFTIVIFFGLSIDESVYNFFMFYLMAVLLNTYACVLGYFLGSCFDLDEAARGLNIFIMLIFMLTAGTFANADTLPPVFNQIQYINPIRYGSEGMLRRISSGSPLQEQILG
jgi:ABC-type polysaccharide/polyol phosphate export permease